MIAIINRGRAEGDLHNYELLINNDSIAKFTHNRADGLAACLRLASGAAKEHHNSEFMDYFIKVSTLISLGKD